MFDKIDKQKKMNPGSGADGDEAEYYENMADDDDDNDDGIDDAKKAKGNDGGNDDAKKAKDKGRVQPPEETAESDSVKIGAEDLEAADTEEFSPAKTRARAAEAAPTNLESASSAEAAEEVDNTSPVKTRAQALTSQQPPSPPSAPPTRSSPRKGQNLIPFVPTDPKAQTIGSTVKSTTRKALNRLASYNTDAGAK